MERLERIFILEVDFFVPFYDNEIKMKRIGMDHAIP